MVAITASLSYLYDVLGNLAIYLEEEGALHEQIRLSVALSFPNTIMHRNSLGILVKMVILIEHSRNDIWDFMNLANSQKMLMLLALGPHFEWQG